MSTPANFFEQVTQYFNAAARFTTCSEGLLDQIRCAAVSRPAQDHARSRRRPQLLDRRVPQRHPQGGAQLHRARDLPVVADKPQVP